MAAQKATGEKDALVVMRGQLKGIPLVCVLLNFHLLAARWGLLWVKSLFMRLMPALTHKIPLICFAYSGGARMQESLISLMQMAKTSTALGQYGSIIGLPYISVMVDPCTGGVSASLAMLGDIEYC